MNENNKGIVLAVNTALFWGVLAVALKVALQVAGPFTIVWFRFAFSFLALFGWFLFTDRSQLRILLKPPAWLLVASVMLGINYIGFMLGIKYTSPSNSQVIIQLGPVLLALAGVVFFKEKINRIQLLGFIIVVLGFILFYHQQITSMLVNPEDFNLGVLLLVIGAITWAVYAVIQKRLIHQYPPQTMNLLLFGFPALLYFPVADVSSLGGLSFGWWALIVFLGLNTLIAYGSMAASLKYIDANIFSSIVINNPIITFLIMALLTVLNVDWVEGERFGWLTWLGAILFLAGAFLVVKARKSSSSSKLKKKK